VLAHRSHDPSFPSDHPVLAGAVTAAPFPVLRRLAALAAVVSLLGFSLLRRLLVWLAEFAERTAATDAHDGAASGRAGGGLSRTGGEARG
jgi:hypothetical protein